MVAYKLSNLISKEFLDRLEVEGKGHHGPKFPGRARSGVKVKISARSWTGRLNFYKQLNIYAFFVKIVSGLILLIFIRTRLSRANDLHTGWA